MRARPREINIFNMSLLDILCGALGAFCFMMLVALPYYVVGGSAQQQENRAKTAELLKDAEALRERLKDPAAAAELQQLMDDMRAQLQQMEGQVNQSSYDNEQLRQEKEKLLARQKELDDRLKSRKPFLVLIDSEDPLQEVDVYLEDNLAPLDRPADKSLNPAFDPAQPYYLSNWINDITGVALPDRGFAVWVASTTAPSGVYRIFAKLRGAPKDIRTTIVSAMIFGDFPQSRLFPASGTVLGPQRFWDLIGTISVDDNYKLTFAEATQAERDQEWRARKMEPPPVPTPPPEATATAAAPITTVTPRSSVDMAELLRLRKELEERRKQQQQNPPAAASPSEQKRALTPEQLQELRQRYLQQKPTQQPSASPAPSAP